MTPVDEAPPEIGGERPERDADRSRTVTRNAGLALAAQIATGLATAGITLFLVRALDPTGYGLFALALGFAALFVVPADFGISPAAARYIAERRGDRRAVAATLATALRLKLALTAAVALALIALASPIATAYGQPDLAWPLRGVAISLFGQSLVFLFSTSFVALGRISRSLLLTVGEAAAEAAATVALVLVSMTASGAAFGRAVGYGVGAALGLALMAKLLGSRAIAQREGGPETRSLAAYAGALLVVDSAYAIFSQVDVLIVGALLGTAAAGIFAAPVKLSVLLAYPGLAISSAIAPRVAGGPSGARDAPALVAGIRVLLIVQMLATVVVCTWSQPIVDLVLGPQYRESAAVLLAFGPFIFLSGFGPLVSTSINYLGQARRRIPIAVGCAVLHVALTFAMVESIGMVGAALSAGISYALYVGGHMRIAAEILELRVRPLGLTLARSAAAGLLAAVLLILLGTNELSPLAWAAGFIGAPLVFGATLIALRETSIAELRSVWRLIAAARRR